MPMFRPESIVDLDDSCKKYKEKYRERLQKAWDETLRVTQPYRFDERLNARASNKNLPTTKSGVLRLGEALVRDQVLQEAHDVKLHELFAQSHFSRKRRRSEARGIKDGAIQLMRGP